MAYKNIISYVWVKDLEAAKDFYTTILGCTVAYSARGWMELSVPGVSNGYIGLNRWTRPEELPKNQFITLGVQDLDLFLKQLRENSVVIKGGITEFYEEGIRMIKFLDPDENLLTAAEVVR